MSRPIGPSLPTIGRIVHVYLPPITVPAIVTAVLSSEGHIACTAFVPYNDGSAALTNIPHNENGDEPATWRWPPVTR